MNGVSSLNHGRWECKYPPYCIEASIRRVTFGDFGRNIVNSAGGFEPIRFLGAAINRRAAIGMAASVKNGCSRSLGENPLQRFPQVPCEKVQAIYLTRPDVRIQTPLPLRVSINGVLAG